jgi:hypothetical protein
MSGSSFTLEIWLKSSSTHDSWQVILEYGASWAAGTFGFHSKNQNEIKIDYYERTGSTEAAITITDWTDGKWHHFAGVLDISAKTLTMYMDGVQKAQITTTGVPASLNSNLNLGSRNGSYYYNGSMDEVRIWNVARTQTQIQENMCKKLAGSESGLVAYYQMTNGSGTTLSDNSSNSNNGTLTNMDDADWVTSGAAIGDASVADYDSPSSVNLASPDGDDVTVGSITNSPDGVQIYRVDSAPNVITAPGNLVQLSPEHYFGVFVVGGTSPTYTLTYNYESHPGISNESALDLAFRADNAVESWTEANATLDQGANTLTLTDQSGTEYILATESSDNSLPVTLASFTAKATKAGVLLQWETSAEIENAGFVIRRQEAGSRNQEEGETDTSAPLSDRDTEDFNQQLIASYLTDNALVGQGSVTKSTKYTFTDSKVEPGKSYTYILSDVDFSGKETKLKEIQIKTEAASAIIADEYTLRPIYPNPFNATFTVSFTLNEPLAVTIILYNISGQQVMTILNNELSAGNYQTQVNADRLSSGVYFVKTNFSGTSPISSGLSDWKSHTQKIVLMK